MVNTHWKTEWSVISYQTAANKKARAIIIKPKLFSKFSPLEKDTVILECITNKVNVIGPIDASRLLPIPDTDTPRVEKCSPGKFSVKSEKRMVVSRFSPAHL